MRQILQNLGNGETLLADVPTPKLSAGQVLIRSTRTVISAGTERMLVDFGKANWIDKARQQPDKVRMVLKKIKTDGLMPTIEAVRSKLDQPLPLGYCNAGTVLESKVDGIKPGDRIVSNGPHAEVVRMPKNLCAKIPDNVDDESAAFTVLGSIALQGVRLAKPTIGESVAVIGLGLIGLITVQILRANGCRVIGIDFDSEKCKFAQSFGAETVDLSKGEDPVAAGMAFSRGRGMDAVIITASTKSDEPVSNAANMSRKRGRIILVGVVGLQLSRAEFYDKELTFQVSCSYGPGRYDDSYELKGQDYPVGFVRWTEQRNFEAILDMMASGAIDMRPLISHRFSFDDALDAYAQLDDKSSLGILLEYPEAAGPDLVSSTIRLTEAKRAPQKAQCSFLGGGNYAGRILIPAFSKAGASLDTIVTSSGASGATQGRKHGFQNAATSEDAVLNSASTDTIAIATRHNLHAKQTCEALKAGKNVFVEKPLAMTLDELSEIEACYRAAGNNQPLVMVGFNRRFSQHATKMKALLDSVKEPKSLVFTINAGEIPMDHWTQDPAIGGGRIIGEACHFIDFARFLVGAPIKSFYGAKLGNPDQRLATTEDKATLILSFEDGSQATIHYLANGDKGFPKERIEAFAGQKVLQLDNFKSLKGFGWKGFSKFKTRSQDKGQNACVQAFVDAIKSGSAAPVEMDQLIEVSRVTIQLAEQLKG
ncbi:bi-domain-containing oxidoreductase [Pelagicoccus sp. NFK12]|uniref:Bi-domain-containing oxidoreductase n=1 Tax=Pelagicoccus enzymogenes TaxID=2773457 RepID=A0A927FBT0_9BACT|nr:bi-domain-containing oxidoreductase [Pelagicoccus enzymogenes]MBD5781451.1 bi-domain-containing oxidoreductase [Pelagicoccus enzymogenes]